MDKGGGRDGERGERATVTGTCALACMRACSGLRVRACVGVNVGVRGCAWVCVPPRMQASVRCRLSRREYVLARAAAVRLQAAVRMRQAKREFLAARSSAVLIQASFRGALARGGIAAQVPLVAAGLCRVVAACGTQAPLERTRPALLLDIHLVCLSCLTFVLV